MALVVFAKAAFYTHAFFNSERVSVSALQIRYRLQCAQTWHRS